jgi:hypothetical protein
LLDFLVLIVYENNMFRGFPDKLSKWFNRVSPEREWSAYAAGAFRVWQIYLEQKDSDLKNIRDGKTPPEIRKSTITDIMNTSIGINKDVGIPYGRLFEGRLGLLADVLLADGNVQLFCELAQALRNEGGANFPMGSFRKAADVLRDKAEIIQTPDPDSPVSSHSGLQTRYVLADMTALIKATKEVFPTQTLTIDFSLPKALRHSGQNQPSAPSQ